MANPTAADVMRDETGAAITPCWVLENLQVGPAAHNGTLVCPDQPPTALTPVPGTVVCGPHSETVSFTCRFDPGVPVDKSFPRTLFLKRCVVPDLLRASPRPDSKMLRDVRSYNNEAIFYREFCPGLAAAGVHVAKTFHCHINHDTTRPQDSGFVTLVEALTAFEQVPVQGTLHLKGSLEQLARFHSHFWCDLNPDVYGRATAVLWDHGGYWDTAKRQAAMPGELEAIAERYDAFLNRFAGTDPAFDDPAVRALGTVLQAKAGWLTARLAEHRKTAGTVIHGDYKNANVFFGKHFARGPGGPTSAGTVTAMRHGMSHRMSMIDWQWTGPGLGVQDVLYLLSTSGTLADLEREDELLAFYHSCLAPAVQETYSLDTMKEHLAVAALDYWRMTFAYSWKSLTPAKLAENKDKFNSGMQVRRLENVVWVVKRAAKCVALLGIGN